MPRPRLMGQPPPDPALTLHSVDESDFHVDASQAVPPVISPSKDPARPIRSFELKPRRPNNDPDKVTDTAPDVGPLVWFPPMALTAGAL